MPLWHRSSRYSADQVAVSFLSPVPAVPSTVPGIGHPLHSRVESVEAGWRLDRFLAVRFPEYSRSFFLKLIQQQAVQVNGLPVAKAGHKVRAGEEVLFFLPPPESSELRPEPVFFDILFEDRDLILINKPPSLVVHPGSGHKNGTLAQGLLYLHHDLPGQEEGRAGLVHRLDKDTSGILLAAKNERALRAMMAAFQDRRVEKIYHAILLRTPQSSCGRIDAPVGRHPVMRQKMAIRQQGGKYAATNWQVQERYANGWCLAEIGLETGRTHQIRVHMASQNTPVAGDALYGGSAPPESTIKPSRQMLHASSLSFTHPLSGEQFSWTAPLWPDMLNVLAQLRALTGK